MLLSEYATTDISAGRPSEGPASVGKEASLATGLEPLLEGYMKSFDLEDDTLDVLTSESE